MPPPRKERSQRPGCAQGSEGDTCRTGHTSSAQPGTGRQAVRLPIRSPWAQDRRHAPGNPCRTGNRHQAGRPCRAPRETDAAFKARRRAGWPSRDDRHRGAAACPPCCGRFGRPALVPADFGGLLARRNGPSCRLAASRNDSRRPQRMPAASPSRGPRTAHRPRSCAGRRNRSGQRGASAIRTRQPCHPGTAVPAATDTQTTAGARRLGHEAQQGIADQADNAFRDDGRTASPRTIGRGRGLAGSVVRSGLRCMDGKGACRTAPTAEPGLPYIVFDII